MYYFSTPGAKRKFLADPLRHCGLLTDPVSRERFQPAKDSPREDHAGRPYFFASDSTRAAFLADPARFAEPDGKMIGAMPDSATAGD
jgi:YHS domain-containing protein